MLLLLAALSALSCAAADSPSEIVLRPDLPAGEEWYTPPSDNPHVKSPTEKWVRKVTRPTLELYPAPKPNGTAIIIAPGGGMNILAIEHEGRDVARWLNRRGISAFVLRYRVSFGSATERRQYALEDGLLAIKTVRSRASSWNLNPSRIGFMGFSAGAFIAFSSAIQPDPSSRPDFAMPIYGGLPDASYQVPANAPPLFLALAFDDRESVILSATAAVRNWHKAQRPAELHIFSDGGHGFGMNKTSKGPDSWLDLLERWLTRLQLLPAAKP